MKKIKELNFLRTPDELFKELSKGLFHRGKFHIKKFLIDDEAQAAEYERLKNEVYNNPNMVPIRDHGFSDTHGRYYVVFEYFEKEVDESEKFKK